MPVIEAHKVDVADGNMAIYNGLDTCLTYEIDEHRQSLRQNDTLIYDFERAMQGPCLEMMTRGFRVDIHERENAIITTKTRKADAEKIISRLVAAAQGSYNPKLIASPKQLQTLFYNVMKMKPIETHFGEEVKRPMNREALERLATQDRWAEPIINGILFLRDLNKSLQVLETDIDPDWRWRCSYNIGGTSTGRWSSSKSPLGTGCVLPTTEALTANGWRSISEVVDGDIIAQWNSKTNEIEWAECSIFKQEFSGHMLKVETEQIKQTLTPGHRVPRYDVNIRNLYVETAQEVSRLSQEVLPLGAKYRPGNVDVPRFAAMLMADFSLEGNIWRAQFTKKRKIERFLSLATEFNLDFEEQKPSREGDRRFVVRGQSNITKKWGDWILNLTPESAEDLLEEARFWDSHDRGSGFIFFTKDRSQAEWFATLAHLVNRAATMRLVYQNEGSYSDTPIWWVNIKSRRHARVQKKHWTRVPYTGTVYCPEVPSSFWLMREDNFISITGNSNFQNINEELRRVFIPDPGFKLYGIDKAQSEARDVGWFCGVVLGDWSYLDMCESGDLHTAVTRLCYPEWAWTGDLKKDRAIADRRCYRFFTFRDISKRLGHGTNYMGSVREMAKQLRLPIQIVQDFQDRYFAAFPCIQRMHRWIAQQIQRERYLVNSFGRRRDFFDRPDSHDTLKGAVAYMFQSATGDCLNLGLWRLWKNMGSRIQVLSQLHDAVYFQVKIPANYNEEQALLRDALDLIQVRQHHAPSGRSMTIPGEAVGGFNWAHRWRLRADGTSEEWNPSGLSSIKVA